MYDDSMPFRLAMHAAMEANDWSEWHGIRAMFGDWLEDREDPECNAARATWEVSPLWGGVKTFGKRSKLFHVPVEDSMIYWLADSDRYLQMMRLEIGFKTNASWLLGFRPGELRFRGEVSGNARRGEWRGRLWRFTCVMNRDNQYHTPDTAGHPDGFLALFHDPRRPPSTWRSRVAQRELFA